MDFKETLNKLGKNPELVKSLEDAYRRNAGTEEISDILGGAAIDAGTVNELLAEYQRRRGEVISAENVDDETLRMVAGGDLVSEDCTQADDCVKHFKEEWMWTSEYEKCEYWMWCDDNFCGIKTDY